MLFRFYQYNIQLYRLHYAYQMTFMISCLSWKMSISFARKKNARFHMISHDD